MPLNTCDVDIIEELRLRRWARENYVAPSQRRRGWHPIILEEMQRRDSELRGQPGPRVAVPLHLAPIQPGEAGMLPV